MSLAADMNGFEDGAAAEVLRLMETGRSLRFDRFVLDPRNLDLHRDGVRVPVQPLPARLLLHLIRNRHRIVSKDELHRVLWPNTYVSDAAVSSALRDLRRALQDEGNRPRIVRTHRGRGVRFIANVEIDGSGLESEFLLPTSEESEPLPDAAPPEVPFVGRTDELDRLDRRVRELVRDGRGALVCIDGITGCGRSALLEELDRQLGELLVVRHRCDEEIWKPRHATLAEILLELFQDAHAKAVPSEDFVERLVRLARDGEGELGLGEMAPTMLARWLAVAADAQPVVLLVDDLHAADPASAAVLLALADELADARVLVVASIDPGRALPELREAWLDSDAERIALNGLELRHVERLAHHVITPLPDIGWLRSLHHYTGGLPGPTLALLHAAGRLAPNPPVAPELPMPVSWNRLLRRRLEALPPACLHLLIAASALPAESDPAIVRAVAGLDPKVEVDLEPAFSAGWILPGRAATALPDPQPVPAARDRRRGLRR